MKHLILGGARSGKSSYAEKLVLELAQEHNKASVYVATATAQDQEMAERIQRHQRDRSTNQWQLIEEPIELATVLNNAKPEQCLLIDCLTLWLSNCLLDDSKMAAPNWSERKNVFLESLQKSPADVVLVSNEVGSGIVPMGELSRRFVDEAGWLHQRLAEQCHHVTQVIAGLSKPLK